MKYTKLYTLYEVDCKMLQVAIDTTEIRSGG